MGMSVFEHTSYNLHWEQKVKQNHFLDLSSHRGTGNTQEAEPSI